MPHSHFFIATILLSIETKKELIDFDFGKYISALQNTLGGLFGITNLIYLMLQEIQF